MVAVAASAAASAGQRPGLVKLVVPADGQVYVGMFVRPGTTDGEGARWGDSRPFPERLQDVIANELGGKKLAFLRVFATFGDTFGSAAREIAEARSATGAGSAVFLDWASWPYTTKAIAAGDADSRIRAWAAAVRSYAKPLLIRLIAGEVNGSWWTLVSPRANPTLTTGDFVAAWRRVVDIFRRQGALNASWAWNVNAFPPDPVSWVDSNIAAYWPGDDYVDWAGADIYDAQPVSDLDGAYDFAAAHHKPFFLAEWGLRIGASKVRAQDDAHAHGPWSTVRTFTLK